MPKEKIICGLDVGSSSIRLVVGQKSRPEEKLHIIGAAEAPAFGINKGMITSIEDAVSSISACLEKAERMVGFSLTNAWVGVSGSHIISQESKGVVAVSKSDGEIRETDVERALEAAQAIASPPNYEILHVIPRSFTVDNQSGIKDPIGMTGIRLEVEAQIIQGLTSQIKNLTKAVYRTSLDVRGVVLGVLAGAEVVITPRQKELGAVVVNIGGSTTSLVVFEEGDVLHAAILPLGSDHITSDIAIGLRTSIDTAERIKIEFGSAVNLETGKRGQEILFSEVGGNEEGSFSKKYTAEIIEARVEEIFEKVDKELKKIQRSGMMPAGVILTGGGSKLPNLVLAAKKKLRLPATLGLPVNISSAIDKVNDLSYTTATGLVLWGEQAERQGSVQGNFSKLTNWQSVPEQAKKWLKSFWS
ncbi:MAG: cell division protein FtsA [Candidatus Buchananbacteria bacterium]